MADDVPSASVATAPGSSGLPGVMHRRLGVPGAVVTGLGSVLGTGVFVSIGLGAGIAGPWVVLAIVIAALLALCNGLSSAQLAAAYPVSGGTYEYGYRVLTPAWGFTAGWMFLCAKSASAATAALGCIGYVANLAGVTLPRRGAWAAGLGLLLTVLVLSGLRRTSVANALIVLVTLVSLTLFITIGLLQWPSGPSPQPRVRPGEAAGWGDGSIAQVLHATALMFVAFTGYGRIATMGEEVREPRRTIPIAVVTTLAVSAVLYVGVAVVGVGTVGAARFAQLAAGSAAPLEAIANELSGVSAWLPVVISIGAITAMLGVLLNLILGLSRVVLAMGRRRDLPGVFARVSGKHTTPVPATLLVGGIVAALTLAGSVEAAWSFSAFTVLVYYGITNLAALRLPREARLYPPVFAWAGLVGCAGLAWFVEPVYWGAGVAVIVAGLVWHAAARRTRRPA